MRILICDDNSSIIEQLNKYIHQYFIHHNLSLPEIATFSSGDALLQDTGEKDLIFLDIEMPGVDGIYVGKQIKKRYPNAIIIIVTSFMEYLDEAMRFHVFRYLSKPIDKNRLFQNLSDAIQLYNSREIKVAVVTKEQVVTLATSEIICIEAQSRKVIVHTTKQDYESIHSMPYWIEALNLPCFFQSHRSFIVNFAHVNDFDNSVIHLYNNQITAYLTRRKYSEFRSQFLLYLESMR